MPPVLSTSHVAAAPCASTEATFTAFLATRAAELLAARPGERLYLSAFITVGPAFPAAAVQFALSVDHHPLVTGPTIAAAVEACDAAHGPEALRARARRLRAEAATLESRLAPVAHEPRFAPGAREARLSATAIPRAI